MSRVHALLLVALVAVGIFPPQDQYLLTLFSEVAIYGLLALSFDVAFGFGGMLSLAMALFYGLAAYTTAHVLISTELGVAGALLLGILASATGAFLLGLTTSRVKGAAFMILTLIVVNAGYAWAQTNRQITGGDDGITLKPDLLAIGGVPLELVDRYRISIAILLIFYLLTVALVFSRFGRLAGAVKQNETRAIFLGLNVAAIRLTMFVWSGVLAGAAGGAYAVSFRHIHTGVLHWSISAEALMHAFFGGLGTLAGPVIGAGVMTLLSEQVGRWIHVPHLVTGALLVLVILFSPKGLLPLVLRLVDAVRFRKTLGSTPPPLVAREVRK